MYDYYEKINAIAINKYICVCVLYRACNPVHKNLLHNRRVHKRAASVV